MAAGSSRIQPSYEQIEKTHGARVCIVWDIENVTYAFAATLPCSDNICVVDLRIDVGCGLVSLTSAREQTLRSVLRIAHVLVETCAFRGFLNFIHTFNSSILLYSSRVHFRSVD
jgi:hypothetical protein